MSAIKRYKLSWFGHVCTHDTLPKTILYRERWMAIVVEEDDAKSRRVGIKECTDQSLSSLLRIADDRSC